MELNIIAFGIAKDILGSSQVQVSLADGKTVGDLLEQLKASYQDFERLASLFVAVNEEYASNETILSATDEVVLIPPVSGG